MQATLAPRSRYPVTGEGGGVVVAIAASRSCPRRSLGPEVVAGWPQLADAVSGHSQRFGRLVLEGTDRRQRPEVLDALDNGYKDRVPSDEDSSS